MKKILSVILSLVLVVTVFAGCSKSDDSDEIDNRITIDTHYSTVDESARRAYERLCTAVINGEDTAKFNTQLLDDVTQLFYTSFPLNALVEHVDVSSDNTGVTITYKNDIDTHKQLVSEFNKKVDEILKECNQGSVGSDRLVFNIYSYIAKNFTIDSSCVSTYDTIIQGKGAQASINSVFEYLVLCAGGEACHMVNYNGSSSIISLVKFNSTMYYFDVGKEIKSTSGEALVYFAMNDSRVARYVSGGFSYSDGEDAPEVTDSTYDDLSSSISYSANDDDISVECSNGEFLLNIA